MYGPSAYSGYGNPTPQQRLAQMEAQFGQYNPPGGVNPYPPIQGPLGASQGPQAGLIIKGRPVSNIQEANAAMIDFDGSVNIFLDRAHRKIYTKQLGMDGNILFEEYSLNSPSQSQDPVDISKSQSTGLEGYVKNVELDQKLQGVYSKLDNLEQRMEKYSGLESEKGGNKK